VQPFEVGRYATMFSRAGSGREHGIYNAGHPSPFLIRHGVAEDPFTEGSFPVGLVPEAEYVSAWVKLEPGDTLILFSDGVTEAMDPAEELYGSALARGADGAVGMRAGKIAKAILESVENFTKARTKRTT